MITAAYTESVYTAPRNNSADIVSAADRKPIKQIFFAAATATTLAYGACIDVSFPTAPTLFKASINDKFAVSVEEPFQYENREEVLKYIADKADVLNLYKSLPVLIENVFGKAKVQISVFKDEEENWSNLRVDIESGHEIEKLSALEDHLFKLLEKDKSFLAALEHVTICCG
jgi:hypothetical protein